MTTSTRSLRLIVAVLALVALIAIIALPVLAADPSASPSPAASADPSTTAAPTATPAATPSPTAAPAATAEPTPAAAPAATDDGGTQMPEKPPKPAKPDKAEKEPGEPVTVSGTVGTRTDAEGEVGYTLDTGSAVLVLEAGPPWFYGDDHPLKAHVGKRVTVVGEQAAGSDEVEVETVDGVAIREPGKPPWAGGWKAQGAKHPGWSEDKAARWQAKQAEKAAQHGTSCWPPGHCKDEPAEGATATNPPGD